MSQWHPAGKALRRCPCGTEPCSWTVPGEHGRLLTALWELFLKRLRGVG